MPPASPTHLPHARSKLYSCTQRMLGRTWHVTLHPHTWGASWQACSPASAGRHAPNPSSATIVSAVNHCAAGRMCQTAAAAPHRCGAGSEGPCPDCNPFPHICCSARLMTAAGEWHTLACSLLVKQVVVNLQQQAVFENTPCNLRLITCRTVGLLSAAAAATTRLQPQPQWQQPQRQQQAPSLAYPGRLGVQQS